MFKIVTYNNNIIKSAFIGIGHIVDEIKIRIDHDGLYCDALDKSHICFAHLELKESVFDEYTISEPVSLNVDANGFMEVLSRCKPKDILTLESDEDNLIITFDGDSSRQFRIKLIDREYETPTPPSVEHSFVCEISTNILKDASSDVDLFSDKIHFYHKYKDDCLYIDGDGNFGETTCKYLIEPEKDGIANSFYPLDKLKDFMKSEKFSDKIQLKSGENIPLIIEFILPNDEGVLSYLLAPRIEQE